MMSSEASVNQFPALETLKAGLKCIFRDNRGLASEMDVLDREPSTYAATFPSEIVTCRWDGQQISRLLCKYSPSDNQISYGHRGGIKYESEVYRHVLDPMKVSVPKFYGIHLDPINGWNWMTIEFLEDSLRLSEEPDPIPEAARWIGNFHAINEARILSGSIPSLTSYDIDYYMGWARRTSQFADHLHRRFPWLEALCETFAEGAEKLLESPTIIHGEYYPKNILFRNETIYPIDWESAAIAAGEIDLASLTEGWPTEIVKECETAYCQTRWPDGAPAEFDRLVTISRMYLHFRWLGDRPEWTHNNNLWRLDELYSLGRKINLI